jgi:hypothetical protein
MTFAPDAQDWKWLHIKGAMLNKPEFDYYIHKIKSGIDIQVMPSGETTSYLFGIAKLETLPYMNPHR